MNQKHCLNCAHFHPLDKSQEIGVCFENNALPPVLRYRFRFESWSCWEENVCGVHAPMFNVSQRKACALDSQVERDNARQVVKAYWQIKAAERKAAKVGA